ncbi:hypothetical protein D9613_001602 [Agrocybe pediades]|uniref:Copper acquisition factor BIM1-like domain-containing protein n=1 Tax=Agrocybe pediades TaxID=84607 RepID=A0A8H4VUT4_9AGAR|nr:hypothetical protein D9613_001602 [Agrocybe pediades]
MNFLSLTFLLALSSAANAHFQLLYPGPRGAFVANDEPNFCGGHTQVTTNRTTFPVSGGFFTIKTGHPGWTAGVIISTVDNPRSFDNFTANGNQQFVRNFAKEADAGTFCVPLNISEAGIEGVRDGSNVTIQIVFDGGDGNLYQCADLTLSSNITSPPSDVTCSNSTSDSSHGSDGDNHDHDNDNAGSGSLSVRQGLSVTLALALGAAGLMASAL